MKKVLFILLSLLPLWGNAQIKYNFGGNRPTDTAWAARSLRIDSTVVFIKYATSDTNKVLGVDSYGRLELRTKTTGGGGGSTDTTSLSNRINLKVDSVYRRLGTDSVFITKNGAEHFAFLDSIGTGGGSVDTTSLSNRIDLKLNISDTAAMLSAYGTLIDGRVKYTDTAAMLSAYGTLIDGRVKYTDTASMLSAYGTLIDGRVKYTDTAAMLSAYQTAINLKENVANKTVDANGTSNFLYPTQYAVKRYADSIADYRVKYTDTAVMLSAYGTLIDGKVNYTDTAAMLNAYGTLIDGKVNYTDTAAMLTGYLRAIDTTNKWVYSVNSQTGTVVLDIDDVAPSQSGNSGKVLTTDGTNATWQTASGGGGSSAGSSGDLQISDGSGGFANTGTGNNRVYISGSGSSMKWTVGYNVQQQDYFGVHSYGHGFHRGATFFNADGAQGTRSAFFGGSAAVSPQATNTSAVNNAFTSSKAIIEVKHNNGNGGFLLTPMTGAQAESLISSFGSTENGMMLNVSSAGSGTIDAPGIWIYQHGTGMRRLAFADEL